MSLRSRLNLLITLMFGITLLVGMGLVIHNARRAVLEEIQSTANLTLQLLEVAFANAEAQPQTNSQVQLLKHLAELEKIRHLHIQLVPSGDQPSGLPSQSPGVTKSSAPGWFAYLVKPDPLELRRALSISTLPAREIVITADPADEITEAWEETRSLLMLFVAFFLFANGLVFVTIGWSLRPANSILKALDSIEQGQYHLRLPSIDLPELEAIAQKFNHMAEVLERSREENRYLAQRSLAIQEQERRFLARELHDEMGQSIAAIKAVAVSISQHDIDPSIKESARTIAEISGHLYEVVRGMVRRLRPAVLDELGLVTALEAVIDDWNAHHEDGFCRFSAQGRLADLSDDIKITIYRIVQECLTNVAKHARATEVEVSLQRDNRIESSGSDGKPSLHGVMMVKITDNGIGIDHRNAPRGLGLLGIRERVEALNGTLKLVTSPGHGVSINIILPVPVKEESAVQ